MTEREYKKTIAILKRDIIIYKNEIHKLKSDRTKRIKTSDVPIMSSSNELIKIAKDCFEEYFNVTMSVKTRKRLVVKSRHMYYYWLRYNSNLSLSEIGKSCNLCQDHSTVLHAIESMRGTFDVSKLDVIDYDNVCSIINERTSKPKASAEQSQSSN